MSDSDETEEWTMVGATESNQSTDSVRTTKVRVGKSISSLLRSTYGPNGESKMLVSSDHHVRVTSDGATLLRQMDIEHPVAKVFTDSILAQERTIGDGSTGTGLLAAELLSQADDLLNQDISSEEIINGFRFAANIAIKNMQQKSIEVNLNNTDELKSIVSTSMTGLEDDTREFLSDLIVSAVQDKDLSYTDVDVEKRIGGNVTDSRFEDGDNGTFVLYGSSRYIVDELETNVKNAVNNLQLVSKQGQVVPGGGATEIEAAMQLREVATSSDTDINPLIVQAFADAVDVIPRTLAENEGMDPIDTLVDLRNQHDQDGNSMAGISHESKKIADMCEQSIFEPFGLKKGSLEHAVDAAGLVIHTGDVIAAGNMEKESTTDIEDLKETVEQLNSIAESMSQMYSEDVSERTIPSPVYPTTIFGIALFIYGTLFVKDIIYILTAVGLLFISATAIYETKFRKGRTR